jgi:hypothetical protein
VSASFNDRLCAVRLRDARFLLSYLDLPCLARRHGGNPERSFVRYGAAVLNFTKNGNAPDELSEV